MTKAGLDPSRIQERAEMLAKLQGTERKRKRDDDGEDVDMDDDEESDGADAEGWMDVDGEKGPKKRVKTNSGAVAVTDRRAPKSDRRMAGMRDEGVRIFYILARGGSLTKMHLHSKRTVPSNCVTLANGLATCWPRQVRVIVLSKQKWSVLSTVLAPSPILTSLSFSQSIYSLAKERAGKHRDDDRSVCFFLSSSSILSSFFLIRIFFGLYTIDAISTSIIKTDYIHEESYNYVKKKRAGVEVEEGVPSIVRKPIIKSRTYHDPTTICIVRTSGRSASY
jgi:hypothetical protein